LDSADSRLPLLTSTTTAMPRAWPHGGGSAADAWRAAGSADEPLQLAATPPAAAAAAAPCDGAAEATAAPPRAPSSRSARAAACIIGGAGGGRARAAR